MSFDFNVGNGVKLLSTIYADDIGFNDLVKLKLNTKLKLAGQLGVQYAPTEESLCSFIQADFTMLAPYMFSHSPYVVNVNGQDDLNLISPNYQYYTTDWQSFGSIL